LRVQLQLSLWKVRLQLQLSLWKVRLQLSLWKVRLQLSLWKVRVQLQLSLSLKLHLRPPSCKYLQTSITELHHVLKPTSD